MRRGYDYLTIAFVSGVVASIFSKIGATTLDIILFMFISYTIGSFVTLYRHTKLRNKITEKIKKRSIDFGVGIGILNFAAYFVLLKALSMGPGSLVLPICGLSVVFIVLFSMILFKERLNWKGIVGVILALISIWLLG